MENKILENVLFTVAGGLVLAAVELKLVQIPEIFLIILSFIGFASLLQGIFGLYHFLTTKEKTE
ncbi:hypothetical protein [uncultured Methanobacterium sp.]|uniref:hypothetical protein n=1 Tax=uncultured Methanobacterium sp. TaxID=176306 RepID=UPI002AA7A50F|nr:hypothetical protein [uncultured Methanobacterium sp.]